MLEALSSDVLPPTGPPPLSNGILCMGFKHHLCAVTEKPQYCQYCFSQSLFPFILSLSLSILPLPLVSPPKFQLPAGNPQLIRQDQMYCLPLGKNLLPSSFPKPNPSFPKKVLFVLIAMLKN